jgi:phospholipid/cholesterol/gamma-HCH transport system substrate-binding protein
LIGVGAFVIGGILLFAVALFMIGQRQMLFEKQFEIYTEFSRLSGLQEGSPIRVNGMAAGEVTHISLPRSPAEKFRLRLQIREDLHPLVRTDSVAAIRTEGLVGGQYLLITSGSESAPQAPRDSTISSREPFDIADLLDQANATVKTVNDTIVTLRGEIETAVQQVSGTVEDADQLVTDVGGDVRTIATAGVRIAADIQALTNGVREGRGTVGQLFVDDELYRRANAIAADAEQTATNLRDAADAAKRLLESIRKQGGPAQGLTDDLRVTLDKAQQTLTNLSENTEALKHNWFFSGYFKRRGYYSLADISPEEYRKGAIEQSGRAKLRIWLQASVLFVTQPDGRLALADGAKPRLDSAMGDFLKYAGSGPLIVEGYAQEGAAAQRFLESRERASLVRDYLLDRFSLNPDRVGVMPLGSEASQSPAGNTWDGIALAVFVPPSALKK